MGWRDSYISLKEWFPQVDERLIKGAALEHGDDVAAAAEFILNDVLGSEEGTQDNVPDPTFNAPNNSTESLELRGLSAEETQAVMATDSGSSLDDSEEGEHGSLSASTIEALLSSEFRSGSAGLYLSEAEAQQLLRDSRDEIRDAVPSTKEIGEVFSEAEGTELLSRESPDWIRDKKPTTREVQELFGESFGEIRDKVPSTIEIGEGVLPEVMSTVTGGYTSGGTETAEEDKIRKNRDALEKLLRICGSAEGKERTINSNIAVEVGQSENVEESEVFEVPRDESEAAPCDTSTSSVRLVQEETTAKSEDGGPEELISTSREGFEGLFRVMSDLQDEKVLDSRIHESRSRTGGDKDYIPDVELIGRGTLVAPMTGPPFESEEKSLVLAREVPRPAQEEHEVALVDIEGDSYADKSSSMLSIQKSAISEEMDRADWEDIKSSSIIQTNQMAPLDGLVEEAKADKEALISSIEEIRVLRLMTDQAEYAARQSREESSRGGADVMAKVEEMRKMLALAREANAVHAGEVFGEKAVLGTEARELVYRLAQVNQEKAKAVTALKEIKASLQARIDSAVQERVAAEQEKAKKELRAKEALAKEEALVAKVAQESRDLDAEAETCTKIRDFLIERGSIVDALQGEVAVLREDAEALKKDLESMSLSYSGSHMHMLSTAASDMYGSMNSRLGNLSGLLGLQSDSLVEVEDGAGSSGSGSLSLGSGSGAQKSTGDKKSWSSLPSLLRGLSSSQLSGSPDLNNSAHSGYSSNGSNLLSSSIDALIANQGEKSELVGLENLMTDMKYPSSPDSANSLAGAQEEREFLKAKMAMFPGEELEMDYSGVNNLDVFRTEKLNELRGEIDEEDWQLLEKGSSRSSSSSVGKET